jgi:hypothetical protein
MGATSGAGTDFPSGAPEFIPFFVRFMLLSFLFSDSVTVDQVMMATVKLSYSDVPDDPSSLF